MPLIPTGNEEEALIAVLEAFGKNSFLHDHFVLKGGNALRWIYQGPRASVDLDFSSTTQHPHQKEAESQAILKDVKSALNSSLTLVAPSYRFATMVVQSAKVLPRQLPSREFPALELKVGYTRQDNRQPPFPQAIKVEISLNEIVCDYTPWKSGQLRVTVSTLDEIISEKLRAILQQEIRRRFRSSDVYDIWFFWTKARKQLSPSHISTFLLNKSEGRDNVGEVTKARFSTEEIRRRSEKDYAEIAGRLQDGASLPPFETAYGKLLELVSLLNIPD